MKLVNVDKVILHVATEIFIGIDDLFDVKSKLIEVAGQWKNIGLALRLKNHQLQTIEDSKKDVSDCLTDMLTLWLNKTHDISIYGVPSWQILSNAVRDPAGGNNPAIADDIYETDVYF